MICMYLRTQIKAFCSPPFKAGLWEVGWISDDMNGPVMSMSLLSQSVLGKGDKCHYYLCWVKTNVITVCVG
jgi:hypothetical protein